MRDKAEVRKGGRRRLELETLKTIREHSMLAPGDRVLVAVSGGADSVAMLHCLHRLAPRLGVSLSVGHLNHGLRGAESDGDEDYVRSLSASLGLELTCETVPLRATLLASGVNLEEAAREARYDFLKKAARRGGCSRIAVGHTQNDQAETVLLRFLRGCGADGLAAIRPIREGWIIRPLLRCSRSDVERYLNSLGVSWRKDSSNLDLRFRRNRLRHEWIPALERHFNPRLIETLSREADLAREIAEFLDTIAKFEFERLSRDSGTAVDIPGLLTLHPALHALVIREALRRCRGSLRGITSKHVRQIVQLCRDGQSGSRIALPGGGTASRQFDKVAFGPGLQSPSPRFRYDLPLPGRCVIPEAGIEVTASLSERTDPPDPVRLVFLNPDSLPGSLIVRSRLPGDRYGGPEHRKVKKMLIDAKIELGARARLPIVAIEGGAVVWIPGFEPAKPFRAQTQSKQSVVVEIKFVSECNS
jgi:tRNA(Ile)-lysidine synthase